MTDISLNPQVSARLRGIQQAWGHDAPGETLATILDSQIHGWLISLPEVTDLDSSAETAIKVRLKPRHVEYFLRISQFSGFSVADSVRSYLIKWLCSPPQTTQVKVQNSVQTVPASRERKFPKPRNKPAKKAMPAPEVTASKVNGRTLLGGLIK